MAKAMKAKKAMAAKKAVKAMKALKKKVVSKIARGRQYKALVFNGTKEKTASGAKKTDFMRNFRGRTVSRWRWWHGNAHPWIDAFRKAKVALDLKGFLICKKGTPLYKKTKELYDASLAVRPLVPATV